MTGKCAGSCGTLLRSTGADIREAANGHDLLGHLETGEFDLIITDLRMPAPNACRS